jgi:DNA repair protein RadC
MVYLQHSKIQIQDSRHVAQVLLDLLALEDRIDRDKEHFYAVHLDIKSRVKLVEVVSLGTLTSSLVHPRETFRRAVMQGSASIIVGHNHPSGEVEPSDEDSKVTKLLFEAGNILGITLLDHVIFTPDHFFSFRSNTTQPLRETQSRDRGEVRQYVRL